jgi:glycolate oxidase iron-sulfur subunit
MSTAAGHLPNSRLSEEEDRLLACVHCGFCLTACPTYTRLGDEGDSPRGRIVLMRAVAEGRLDADTEAFGIHIDQCLGCRACEPVCPSGVQYGFLVERARAAAVDANGQRLSTRLLLGVFGSRSLSALAGFGGRVLRAGGFAGMLARALPKRLGAVRMGLAMLAATRPARHIHKRPTEHGVTNNATRADAREFAEPHALRGGFPEGTSLPPRTKTPRTMARVALLRGCVQHALYRHVNDATRLVLEDAGCEIIDVPGQQCCGALHAHSGALDHALDLARTNTDAFLAADPDIIVVNAAGCGAMLKEYREQLAHDPDYATRAEALSARVRDVSEYLAEIDYRSAGTVSMDNTPLRVTYDAPCHLLHAQRITDAPTALIAAVPGVELVPLDRADECCGGAGIYGITHPDIGGRILADKVAAVVATEAHVVLTPNPGCMMQIGAGLILAGHDIPAIHPIEILARSVSAQGER